MAASPALLRFVEDELARAEGLADQCAAGMLNLLRDAPEGDKGADRGAAFDAAQLLQRRQPDYVRTFAVALRRHIEQDLRDTGAGSAPAGGIGSLELVDEASVDVDIEISRALQAIDGTAEWELRELQTFTSTLCGQTHVTAESNPLRPLAYASALWDAACAVATARAQQTLLLRTSSGVMAGLLKKAWAAASSRLEAQGVTPGIYKTVVMAPGAAVADRQSTAAVGPISLGGLSPALGGAGVAPAAGAAGASAGGGAGRPTQVVDWLARLFAVMQADARVPATLRALIARLQVCAMRLATAEPEMVEQRNHPLWRLIDAIGGAGTAYPSQGDPRLTALLECCEHLAEDVAQTPAGGEQAALRRADARLQAFLAGQWQTQAAEAQAAIASLQHAERRDLLESRLAQRLSDQMAGITAPPAVRRFVTSSWARVLASAMLDHGEQAPTTQTWLKTVDDLLWSLHTPDHPQSRQRLLALLPSLLQRLRDGMASIALPAAEQQAVLDALMAVHTEALRPGGRAPRGPLTAEQIVQQMRDEVIEAAPAARPFADSVIDLASLETVPAELMSQDDEAAAGSRVAALEPGQRHRLFLRGRWMRTQLLWRSEQGLYLLFAGEQPSRTHSITRRALERLDAAGLLQPLEPRPLVQRSIDALRHELVLPA